MRSHCSLDRGCAGNAFSSGIKSSRCEARERDFRRRTYWYDEENPGTRNEAGGAFGSLDYIPMRTGMTIGALLVRAKRNPANTSVRLFFT